MSHRTCLSILVLLAVLLAPWGGVTAQGSPAAVTFTITPLTDNAQDDTEPVLAVDGDGKAHIAYTHANDVHYISNASGSWITQTIAADAVDEFRPSIALDVTGTVHLSYYAGEAPSVDLYYADNEGGTWGGELIETVGVANVLNIDGGIAVDDAGRAYVVYLHFDGNDHEIGLRYQEDALGLQAGWVGSTLTDNTADDRWPSVAVDGAGTVHIAYQSPTGFYLNDGLYHLSNPGGVWTTTLVAAQDFSSYAKASIAVDGSGKAHVAAECGEAMSIPEICYFTNLSGAWITETLTLNEDHENYPAITLGSAGKAYVAYVRHDAPYHVYYATNASGTWSSDQVSSGSNDDMVSQMDRSVAVDAAGHLHIVWSSADAGGDEEIYYARSDQPIAPPPNQAPNAPHSPTPADGASNVSGNVVLRWQGGDPDAGDTVTYDVYLSTGTIPYLEKSGVTTTAYTPTTGLKLGWSYAWKIIARDQHGAATEGPVWSFNVEPNADVKIFLPCVLRQ